ncbi:MAG: tetratricopeptide repeat protein [Mangrovicoccus sp.]|nr:tetratricopeptide repeat protein [Mangrovicoccus sp.]
MATRYTPAIAGLFAFILLVGCESVDDKVARLYSEAQELAVAGEPEKARLVLKNIFDLDGYHRDARMLYANQSLEIGSDAEAYRHFLLVAEQYPEHAPAHVQLAKLASASQDWRNVERHVAAAERLGEEGIDMRALRLALDYRDALDDEDDVARRALAQKAVAQIEAAPDSLVSHRLIIDNLVRDAKPYEALAAVDVALEIAPLDPELNRLKLGLLAQTQQSDEVGAHLKVLTQRFPENSDYRASLIRWFLSNGDVTGAETYLRSLVVAGDGDTSAEFTLVQFLQELRGPDAALAELDQLIATAEDPLPFERRKAAIQFEQGAREPVIAHVEQLISTSEPSPSRRDLQISLARMYLANGNTDQAKTTVRDVLAEEARHVDALVMNAGWLIEEDQVRDAILQLRTALDQSPENIPAINMLAAAYERDGNRDLMGETLLLAATSSGYAPAESQRYARFLASRDKLRPAEDVLLRGLRNHPKDTTLLLSLGEVYLALDDIPRTEQVIKTLQTLEDNAEAKAAAAGLQTALYSRTQRPDETIELLHTLIDDGSGGLGAHAAIVRTHLSKGDFDAARRYVDEARAKAAGTKAETGLLFVHAALLSVEGDNDGAKAVYQDLVEREPNSELVWRALIITTMRSDAPDAIEQGEALLQEALGHMPQSTNLRWMQASIAERKGNVDEAIEIYETMYAENSSSSVVANNLASLITTHRDDTASLERAYVIARRLRGSELPAFRDTYGWIAYRMGNYSEAEEYLKTAAQGLPQDPLVQYHLGKTYAALRETDAAVKQFRKALEIWKDSDLPQALDAKAELARLQGLKDGTGESPAQSAPAATPSNPDEATNAPASIQ